MSDAHQIPCIHSSTIAALQRKDEELDGRVRKTEGDLREVASELGSDSDTHSVLGRLKVGEDRDDAMAKDIAKVQETILTKDVMERTIRKAAAWMVGAIVFVGGPPAVIATVKMLWTGRP